MALREILQNIHSYIDILQQSRSRAVETWRADDVKNALNWATYCEKIYAKSVGKSYQDDLDNHIDDIGQSRVLLLGGTKLRLELMKDASLTLRESLLQNPWLPHDAFQVLMDKTDAETILQNLVTTTKRRMAIDSLPSYRGGNVQSVEVELLQDFVTDNLKYSDSHPIVAHVQSYLDTTGDM